MIEFSCVCKQYKFSLPPDMAGGLIQCPTCRRLVDVPSLHELAHIDEDGGYKFEGESTSKTLDSDLAIRAFSSRRVDEFGEEIDLRNSFEEIQRAGVPHTPGMLDGIRPLPPKYDPVTGELIRPLAIKNDTPQRVLSIEPESDEPIDAIPLPAVKLSYSVGSMARVPLGRVFILLFRPANLIVLCFALLMHLLVHSLWFLAMNGFFIIGLLPIALFMGLFGHYGNVLDDTGPGGRDELPTPLRNVSFYDDIWKPFADVSLGLLCAFSPWLLSRVIGIPAGARSVVELICLFAGLFAAPALLLTAVTSGTVPNLRPDRVAGVIGVCGSSYITVCFTFALGCALYWFGFGMAQIASRDFMRTNNVSTPLMELALGYGVLAGGIYVMHAFCWQMGLLYRTHHDRFPWILQRHVPVRMAQRTRSHPGHLPPLTRT